MPTIAIAGAKNDRQCSDFRACCEFTGVFCLCAPAENRGGRGWVSGVTIG